MNWMWDGTRRAPDGSVGVGGCTHPGLRLVVATGIVFCEIAYPHWQQHT